MHIPSGIQQLKVSFQLPTRDWVARIQQQQCKLLVTQAHDANDVCCWPMCQPTTGSESFSLHSDPSRLMLRSTRRASARQSLLVEEQYL